MEPQALFGLVCLSNGLTRSTLVEYTPLFPSLDPAVETLRSFLPFCALLGLDASAEANEGGRGKDGIVFCLVYDDCMGDARESRGSCWSSFWCRNALVEEDLYLAADIADGAGGGGGGGGGGGWDRDPARVLIKESLTSGLA